MATDDDTLIAPPNATSLLNLVDDPLTALPLDARYVESGALGEGGMGEVVLVRDLQIGRDVALKTIRTQDAGRADLRARFVREARVQGQLEHPAIVPVYDLYEDGAKRVVFTMKRVQGETLEAILERLRAGQTETAHEHTRHKLLAAFVRVCLAVDYAHARGVIHRDLKPANVMLGRFGEVYVLDWGVASVHDRGDQPEEARLSVEPTSSPKLTAAGSMIGTPAYMAPEQFEGTGVDPRTDVYALGGILFELLTLESLPGGSSTAAIMTDVLRGVDARASARAPHRDVPPELEAICVRASARRPAQRYGSARDLADAVEAFLSGDRDVELRRDIARAHLDRAKEAAAAARDGSSDLELRRAALREVGRAVAVAPEDPDALSLLVELLTELPKELPKEVLSAVDEQAATSQRVMLPKASLAAAVVGVALVPAVFMLGPRHLLIAVLVPGTWLLCSLVAWLAFRFDTAYRDRPPYLGVFLALAAATTTLLYGPLLIAPTLCVGIAAAYTATLTRRHRYLLVAMMAAAFVTPGLLALLDLHPVHEAFTGDALVIRAGVHVSRVGTYAVVTGLQLAALAFSVRFVARYRDALTASESHNQLMAWQLGQLVPHPAAAVRVRAHAVALDRRDKSRG